MGGGYSLKNLKEGLPLFFLDRIHYFLDLDKFGSLHLLFLLVWGFHLPWSNDFPFLGLSARSNLSLETKILVQDIPGVILGVFFLVFIGILSSSVHIERNATRYFLPLASFFPIAIGYGVVCFRKHWRMIPIFLCLLLFFVQMAAKLELCKSRSAFSGSCIKNGYWSNRGAGKKGNPSYLFLANPRLRTDKFLFQGTDYLLPTDAGTVSPL